MATDAEAPRPRDAEIPLTNIRSAPKLALARPPPTRQTVRKGRLNCPNPVRIVASIEEPTAIREILDRFAKHAAMEEAHYRPAVRAPPAVAA